MSRLARALLAEHLRQPAQALLVLAGLGLAVAVVVAIDVAIGSARLAFAEARSGLVGAASHRVESPGEGFDESLLGALAARGLALAPVVEGEALHPASGRRLAVLGVDPLAESAFRAGLAASAEAGAPLSDWLARDDALLLPRGLASSLGIAAGDDIALVHDGSERGFRVAGLHGGPTDESPVLMDVAAAQRLLDRMGRLDRIDLRLEPDAAARLALELPPGTRLVATAERDRDLAGLSRAFEINLQALGWLALLVGCLVVFQTLAFLALRRRPLYGLLRALGVDAPMLLRLVAAEALVLALLAMALGIPAGLALAQLLVAPLEQTWGDLFGALSIERLALEPATFARAAVLALGGAALALVPTLWQTARTPPLAGMADAAGGPGARRRDPRAWLRASLSVAAGLSLLAWLLLRQPGLAAAFASLFAILLAALAVVPVGAWLGLRWLEARLPAGAPVARRWLLGSAWRSLDRIGIALGVLSLALATLVGISTMIHSFRLAVGSWIDRSLQADAYLVADGEGALPPALLDEVLADARLRVDNQLRRRQLHGPGGPLALVAAQPGARSREAFEFLGGTGPAAAWAGFDRGGALASESLATRLGLEPGDRMPLPTARGEVAIPIAGIYRDYTTPAGVLTLPMASYRALFDDDGVGTLALLAVDGDAAAMAGRIEPLADAHPGVRLVRAAAIREGTLRVFDRTFAVTDLLRLLAAAIAAVAVLGALSALQIERRREVALLRALGLSRRGLLGLQLLQAGVLGAVAGVLALPLGVGLAAMLTEVINRRAFGWSMSLSLPPGELAVAVLLAVLVAVAAAAWPAWRQGRQPLERLLRGGAG